MTPENCKTCFNMAAIYHCNKFNIQILWYPGYLKMIILGIDLILKKVMTNSSLTNSIS